MSMRFVDEVKIRLLGGRGGNGCVSFRREKYVPRGGPDGGDGGKGGDVILEASGQKHTLLDFRYRRLFHAASGAHGQGKNRQGKSGDNLILQVPPGTLAKDPITGQLLADLTVPGDRWIAARGGLGGKGNAHFASSTHRVPRFAQEGQEGEDLEILLELKLLADVGLVGLPNAGKSTLIAAVSAARPKIADYPFTTLVPNLGVVQFEDQPPFVMADIPGLIEGAHKGMGLGTRFLRHVERCQILVHLIDISQVSGDDVLGPFRRIERELALYSWEMKKKRRVIVLNKVDLAFDSAELKTIIDAYLETGHPVFSISALKRIGLTELLQYISRLLVEPASSGRDYSALDNGM